MAIQKAPTIMIAQDNGIVAAQISTGAIESDELAVDSVITAKIANASVTPAKLSQPLTYGTPVTTTSGTEHDFDGIPSWATKIEVCFYNVSISGSAFIRIRALTASGAITSGYATYTTAINSGTHHQAQTAGFDLYSHSSTAAYNYNGALTFRKVDTSSNNWIGNGIFGADNDAQFMVINGRAPLSEALTGIRVTTSNGTDTFDAGTINISYE